MRNVRTLYLHARLAMAAAFLAILLFAPAKSIFPNGVDLAHAAGTLTVSSGGPYSGTVGVAVTMTATVTSATTSPSYTWNFGDGSGATGQSVSHVYSSARGYRVSVTVVDATGASGVASTSASITGSGGSGSLSVSAHGPYSGTVGSPVTMSAGATDASPRFTWNFGDGTTATGQTVSHTYGTATTYTVNVSVTDSVSGASGSAATSATITGGSTSPLTVTANGPYSGTVGVPVSMFASATDSSPLYTWNFGDGTTGTGQSVSHTYSGATTYTVTLNVTDSLSGANGAAATSATITGSGSTGAIQVSAGGPYSGSAGVAITMIATANDANPSYTWNFGDGTTGFGQEVGHTYSAASTFTVTVTVNDLSTGLTGTASTTASTNGTASTSYEYCNGTYELASQCSATTGYQECDGTLIPTTTVCGYSSASSYTCELTLSCGTTSSYYSTCGVTYSCGSTSEYSSTCGVTYACGETTDPYLNGYESASPYTSSAYGSYGGSYGSVGTAAPSLGTSPAVAPAMSNAFAGHTNPLTGQGFNGVSETSTLGSSGTGLPTTAALSPNTTGSSVTYSSGWNLVAGVPGATLANVDSGPLAFSPAQDSYQSVDPSQGLQSGQGYWVNFSASTTVNLPAAGGQQASVSIPTGGYVLVGDSTGGQLTVNGPDAVWTYDPSSGSYTQTTTLNPGQAGWAYSAGGATASFSSTGATTTSGGS